MSDHHMRPRTDFWLYWAGESISNLGSAVTLFALPLLVFRLTGSALNLGLSAAAEALPYLLFGLVIGAWVDRLDRKRLMIVVDLLQALTIASIPAAYACGVLSVWWMYGVGFLSATLKIGFEASQFAVLPNLVDKEALVTANGRIQASFSLAQMLGPVLAGALLFALPLPALLLLDAGSFLISACALGAIKVRFNATEAVEQSSVRQEIGEGLRYVLTHPVLRAMSVMTLLLNPLLVVTTTQLVLLATVVYRAGNQQVSLLFAAGSLGGVLVSLVAGSLLKRWSFSKAALFALFLLGGLLMALGFTPWYPLAVVVWGLSQGAEMLFNLNTRSLCQAVVPDHLLGRAMSVLLVLAYTTIPLGALLGGILLQGPGAAQVARVYVAIGLVVCLGGLGFSFSALGHAERYLPHRALAQPSARVRARGPALSALLAGMRATAPFALGVMPQMILYGVTALQAGLSPVMAQAMALLVFSGAILPAAQALHAGTPVLVAGLMIVLLNARHVLYSARLAPNLRRFRRPRRLLASYLLTDESFGADARRAREGKYQQQWWWFLVGAGLTMWLAVQGATAVGLALGTQMQLWDGLRFVPTLLFVCLTVLSLKGPVSVAVALSAGLAAALLAGVPLGLGLFGAVGAGVIAGQLAARLARRRSREGGEACRSGS